MDPDNRTPVDYGLRQKLLNELKSGMKPEEIMRRADSGLPKLWIAYSALGVRGRHPDWFGAEAEYSPLPANGAKCGPHWLDTCVARAWRRWLPRWPVRLGDSWGGTTIELPAGQWRNVLTGDRIEGGRARVQAL